MKKILFFLYMLVFLSSCSEELIDENKNKTNIDNSNTVFSFNAITAPNVWAQFESLEVMLKACQIPNEKIKLIPTDELVELCMTHPLHSLYFAYNNELDGANVIIDNFNGFNELKNRMDAPQKVIDFYNQINFKAKLNLKTTKTFSKLTNLGFMELFIASKKLPQLYEGEYLYNLEKISNQVLEMKLNQPQKSFISIKHSLLINAQIKLENNSISTDDSKILNHFIETSGNMENPQDYTIVSSILAK